MGDAVQSVPLLSSYKHGLVARRIFQTATGGLKLRRSLCCLNLLQLLVYLAPLALAVPFLTLDALGVWREHYLALVYVFIHTLAVFTLRLCVHCSTRGLEGGNPTNQSELQHHDGEDDALEITSCHSALSFVCHSQHVVSLVLHSLLVSPLLSLTSSYILLPRVLTHHLPLSGAVVVGVVGWLVTCGVHYSLSVNRPHETAIYRPTDLLNLGPVTRPAYFITCATIIITLRLLYRCKL